MVMKMNGDLKKLVGKVKATQKRLQEALQDTTWIEDARQFAKKQGKEVKTLITSDLDKVKSFLEKERKELEKFQKQIPGEVKKLRTFVKAQRQDLEKLLAPVGRTAKKPAPKKKASAKKKSSAKTSSTASAT
jgi:dsDNA-specific endonuclease/ATPase MutS2